MPWPSGKGFAAKHNKKLTGTAAKTAADVANAILRKTGDEGKAIRIANSIGDKQLAKRGARKPKAF